MPNDILQYWFEESTPAQWFQKDLAFDAAINERFGELHKKAIACELAEWRSSPKSSLAEIIILDQFSRNIYRHKPKAFAADPLALGLAQVAIAKGFDALLAEPQRMFLYMPFMHSESKVIHEQAVTLFTDLGQPDTLDFELKHKAIIDRFGRYPHRNDILGRDSTPEEISFLSEPNSGF